MCGADRTGGAARCSPWPRPPPTWDCVMPTMNGLVGALSAFSESHASAPGWPGGCWLHLPQWPHGRDRRSSAGVRVARIEHETWPIPSVIAGQNRAWASDDQLGTSPPRRAPPSSPAPSREMVRGAPRHTTRPSGGPGGPARGPVSVRGSTLGASHQTRRGALSFARTPAQAP